MQNKREQSKCNHGCGDESPTSDCSLIYTQEIQQAFSVPLLFGELQSVLMRSLLINRKENLKMLYCLIPIFLQKGESQYSKGGQYQVENKVHLKESVG